LFFLEGLGFATITELAGCGYGRNPEPRGIVAGRDDGAYQKPMAPPNNDEQKRATARIDELETRLAQQDQSLLELSDELYRQQRHIARLETELGQLVDRMKTVSAPEPASSGADEVPPHY